MIYPKLVGFLAAVSLAACASGPKKLATRSSFEIESGDLRALRDGLGNGSPEVSVGKSLKAKCETQMCRVPVVENLPVFVDGKLRGSENLAGHLGFQRPDLDTITSLMQKAEKSGGEENVVGERGGVYCRREKCTLKFNLFGEDVLPVSRLMPEPKAP